MGTGLGVVLATLAGLVAPRGPTSIHGGNEAQTCQLPMVVAFRNDVSKCTGTLIHPQVVLTAAHCVEGPGPRMRFGESFATEAFGVDVEVCVPHPDFVEGGAPADDIAVCRLVEPVEAVPRVPLLVGCEAEVMLTGAEAVIAGFGQSDTDAAFGTKRYAFSALASDLRSDGTVYVGDPGVNGCLGDSGGPVFVRMPDDTWRVAGVLTYGPECGDGASLYASVVDRLAWLQEASGVDLAPCHDDFERWSAAEACDPATADPLAVGEDWADDCAGAVVAREPVCDDRPGSGSSGGPPDPPSGTSTDTGFSPPLADTTRGCGCHGPVDSIITPWWVVLAYRRRRS